MSLPHARAALKQTLLVDAPFSVERARRVDQLAMDWFNAYKDWERADTFKDAITEGRMCISQRGEDTVIGDGNPAWLNAKDIDQQGPRTQATQYRDLRYRTGVDSVKDRLKPSNFGVNTKPLASGVMITRMKYKLGLHDLSASLFNPAKPRISEQARWDLNGSKKDWPILFMPLPAPADLVVYDLLSTLRRDWRTQGNDMLVTTVDHIRRRMTRVKFAQDSDMGAGLINAFSAGSGDPNRAKFRYGMADVQSELRGQTWVPVYRQGISLVRRAKALEYQSILATQAGSSNEIVVAFRQHANPEFPVITRWDGAGCRVLEGGTSIPGAFIADTWRETLGD